MRFQIPGKIVLKKIGDKPVSEQLKEMVLEKSKEIKLTVPFQASGTFSKQPLQPDGVTPVVVEPVKFNFNEEMTPEEKKLVEKKEKENIQTEEEKPTKEYLESLSLKELKKIGNKLGTTDRSKSKLIKEILKLQ